MKSFKISISDAALVDLQQRLRSTRWPEKETVNDWSQGIPLAYLQELCEYWSSEYQWRERESLINQYPQFITNIEGLDIHFIHLRSPEPGARPLILTHGWPGSVLEFLKVIGPLSNPVAHGGQPEDAFHIVCPSLPGYGFSGKPTAPGWGVVKIALVWDQLMQSLGYRDYWAQGGDWGAAVTTAIGSLENSGCTALHLNFPVAAPTESAKKAPTEADLRAFKALKKYQSWETGYSTQQKTRPQTLAYGLVDSPVALAAWIIEKFQAWTDCDGHPENILSRDELLDNVMLYWLTASGGSSARLYWESFDNAFSQADLKLSIPVAVSMFPKEIIPVPRSWAETRYGNIVYWHELQKGGHFAAFEQPELFVREMRNWLKLLERPAAP